MSRLFECRSVNVLNQTEQTKNMHTQKEADVINE